MDKNSMEKFKQQKEALKRMYEEQKTGDQSLFREQEKLFKPVIQSQEKIAKQTQDKIISGQDVLNNALIPFANELRKSNNQMDSFHELPFYNFPYEIQDVPQSTPKKEKSVIQINLDGELLSQTHLENLQDMSLNLPSQVQKDGNIEEILDKIKTKNRSIGQYLGGTKTSEQQKIVYESRKATLKIYKDRIMGLKGAKQFLKKSGEGLMKRKFCKQKRGKGRPKIYPDTLYYNNPNELGQRLWELIAAKRAGNTGVDNSIVSILDELLNTSVINKNDFDILNKSIFI